MKRLMTLAIVTVLGLSTTFAKGVDSKHTTLKNDIVTLSYGQPVGAATSVVPEFGTPWGTGTGEIAEITLSKGCLFADKQVNPGTYSLITVPFKGEWLVFLVNPKDAKENMKDLETLRSNSVLSSNAIIKHTEQATGYNVSVKTDGILISWDKNTVFFTVKG